MITQSPNLIEDPKTALSSLSLYESVVTTRLVNEDRSQALRFLAERPLHNVVMAGLIRDNGIESKFNRGTFYASRNAAEMLVGIALIGHAVFIDARCDEALRQFAQLAQHFPRTHMLMGEAETVERFWKFYAPHGQPRHRVCREVLLELSSQPMRTDSVPHLRLAEVTDLSLVVPVHATMAFEESGVNPLQVDPDAFRQRCRRRIEERRTWVMAEQDRLIFKADVISETPEVIYLEGVYVHPQHRDQGHGSRCLAQLARKLLDRTKSISVLVNEERVQAQRFFCKLGFVPRGWYDTYFLRTQPQLL
ncbi:MAG TPA: GNAT family N-acetyltransferase [Pyrinomonadaceae bacterium]|jgi:predicted GNAT family acetyltransferase|nr:GNAT family N-acetyltransferase [Pyrinomonadaceae bacterium]